MLSAVEILLEILFEVFGEVVLQGVFEGLGWTLRRRWGRIVVGVVLGCAGGFLWSVGVNDDLPLLATALVAGQLAAIPLLTGRTVLGRELDRSTLADLAMVGVAVVAGRYVGLVVTNPGW
jgi:drug/metabolite transporter (DMT)-like permease